MENTSDAASKLDRAQCQAVRLKRFWAQHASRINLRPEKLGDLKELLQKAVYYDLPHPCGADNAALPHIFQSTKPWSVAQEASLTFSVGLSARAPFQERLIQNIKRISALQAILGQDLLGRLLFGPPIKMVPSDP